MGKKQRVCCTGARWLFCLALLCNTSVIAEEGLNLFPEEFALDLEDLCNWPLDEEVASLPGRSAKHLPSLGQPKCQAPALPPSPQCKTQPRPTSPRVFTPVCAPRWQSSYGAANPKPRVQARRGRRAGQLITRGIGSGRRGGQAGARALPSAKQGGICAAQPTSPAPRPAAGRLIANASRAGSASSALRSGARVPNRGRRIASASVVGGRAAALRALQPNRPQPFAMRTVAGRPCGNRLMGGVPCFGFRKRDLACNGWGNGLCGTNNTFNCPWTDLYDGPVEVASHWWEGPVAQAPIALDTAQRDQLESKSPATLDRIDQRQRLSLADILQLSRLGLPKDLIIDQLRSTKTCYHLTNQQIFQLQKWMVNPDVIAYLQFCSGET